MAALDRAPFLRFSSPSALAGARRAIRGRPRPRTLPLRRLITCRPARVRGPSGHKRRPCGFSPCEYDAVKLDMRTFVCLIARAIRRVDTAAKRAGATNYQRSFTQGPVGATGAVTLANDPSHQAPPLREIRRSQPVMHRRFSWRDVPLPARAFAAWHDEWSFPLLAVRRSWGFKSPFAGLLPRRMTGHL
jgi:hypothetical protein